MFAERLFQSLDRETRTRVFIHADQSSLIRKGLVEGYIDVACVFSPAAQQLEIEESIVKQHACKMGWVKSRDFVLSPGTPIPIISLPEDDWMIGALQKRGSPYRIVVKSPDYSIRLAAVRASIGLTAMPETVIPPDLIRSQDYYLPELADHNLLVCTRKGLDSSDVREIARKASNALFPDHEFKAGDSVRSASKAPDRGDASPRR